MILHVLFLFFLLRMEQGAGVFGGLASGSRRFDVCIFTPKKKQERRGKECLSCFVFQETCYHFLFIRRCYSQEDLEKARVVLLPMFFFSGEGGSPNCR